MEYELACMATGLPGRKMLTEGEYLALREARACLDEILTIEENYNGLLDRYIAMQRELVAVILHVELHRPVDGIEFHGFLQRLAREAANLLSAGRQYLDHTDHALAEICRVSDMNPLPYGEWRSHEHDRRLGYRAIEAIRNAAQHRVLPSQGMSIGGGWRDVAAGRERQQTGSLRVIPRVLGESPKFKKRILQELLERAKQSSNESVDFMDLAREHLTGLSVVHAKIRDGLKERTTAWEKAIEDPLLAWRASFGKDYSLTAYPKGKRDEKSQVKINGDILLRRRRLEEQNSAGEHTFNFRIYC